YFVCLNLLPSITAFSAKNKRNVYPVIRLDFIKNSEGLIEFHVFISISKGVLVILFIIKLSKDPSNRCLIKYLTNEYNGFGTKIKEITDGYNKRFLHILFFIVSNHEDAYFSLISINFLTPYNA